MLSVDKDCDIEPVWIAAEVDIEALLARAYELEELDPEEELEIFESNNIIVVAPAHPSSAPQSSNTKKRSATGREEESSSHETKWCKTEGEEAGARKQSYANRKRKWKKERKYEESGHLDSYNEAIDTASPLFTNFDSATLSIAKGAYVGVDATPYGRTVSRKPEYFAQQNFRYVRWHGNVARPIIDSKGRVLVVGVKKIKKPKYQDDIKEAFHLIEQTRGSAPFESKDKRHKRGAFPAAAYGISYGKGQPRPKRLGGKLQPTLSNLLNRPCFQSIAEAQSAAFATWSPKNYQYYFERNKELREKLPDLQFNYPRSVFACMTINFGPKTRTFVHADSKNTTHGMCAITSGGNYDSEKGGHLVLWDLKIIMEFPPGCTILLPSALLLHSNTPVQEHETRYSITQYSAGGIWHWLDDGGHTEIDIKKNYPDELAQVQERKLAHQQHALDMFSTWDELRQRRTK